MKTTYHHRLAAAALAAFSLLALVACNSTSVSKTWTDQNVSRINFKKVMVVATFPDGASRRIAEDTLKSQITDAECVTSYSVLSGVDVKDADKVSEALKAANVDGVVVMRPISDKNEVSITPGMVYPMAYRTFRGYYSRYYALSPFYNDFDYYSVNRVVKIETNIYEAASGRLLWSAATTSTNPGDLPQLIKDATAAIRAELVNQHLVPQN